jgi:hypothetical protein
VARLGRRWPDFGCAGAGFRTEGGDPGEKVLHVDASLDRGDNGTRLLWSKRRSQLERLRVNEESNYESTQS